jgi:hypothetical protein
MLTWCFEYSQVPLALKVDKKSGDRVAASAFFMGRSRAFYISVVWRVSRMHRTPNRLTAAAIDT